MCSIPLIIIIGSGVKKITSTSRQDFSLIVVEFNVTENIKDAKQQVKDAVDKAKKDAVANTLSLIQPGLNAADDFMAMLQQRKKE